ncbi:hypothetical protein C8R43DRAFT_977276 [Mycena crocata]|nr:hypothetical protein C8R43DRAFT_977276 [Mycena crocata]
MHTWFLRIYFGGLLTLVQRQPLASFPTTSWLVATHFDCPCESPILYLGEMFLSRLIAVQPRLARFPLSKSPCRGALVVEVDCNEGPQLPAIRYCGLRLCGRGMVRCLISNFLLI